MQLDWSFYWIRLMAEWTPPQEVNLVDLGFMDARSKLIDVAAFLDRVQRAGQGEDFRVVALKKAIEVLSQTEATRAKEVLLSFSDASVEPIAKATTQGACGAVPPQVG
jgi:hypothetical protein